MLEISYGSHINLQRNWNKHVPYFMGEIANIQSMTMKNMKHQKLSPCFYHRANIDLYYTSVI